MTPPAARLSKESDVSCAGRFLTPLFANTDPRGLPVPFFLLLDSQLKRLALEGLDLVADLRGALEVQLFGRRLHLRIQTL